MKRHLIAVIIASLFAVQTASAAGIPVVDAVGNQMRMTNHLESIAKMIEEINQMQAQLAQAKAMYASFNGARGMAQLLNNPALKNQLPSDWLKVYNKVQSGGYSGLTGAAAAIRDAEKLANSSVKDAKTSIQQRQANKYATDKAMGLQAYDLAKARLDNIQDLMANIDSATDPKAIADLQARIATEQATIQNEQTKMQLMSMLQGAEEKLIAQQKRELNQRILNSQNRGLPQNW